MPTLFLSPSTQYFNPYVTTGDERFWMNQLADRMVPYLQASGITVTRNDPEANAATSIRLSNAGSYDFHLALHSNASPSSIAGRQRGIDAYYYPTSEEGLRMANILVDNLKPIYPLPDLVRALTSTSIGEVRRTRAPSVLIELGYHDNFDDASWLTENLEAVAAALSEAVTEYFGVPFLRPTPAQQGIVTLQSGNLNLRSLPDPASDILARIPNGTRIPILGTFNDWYSTEYQGESGYVFSQYISLA